MRHRQQDPQRCHQRHWDPPPETTLFHGMLLWSAEGPREASEAKGAPVLTVKRPLGPDAGSTSSASAEGPGEASNVALMLFATTGSLTTGNAARASKKMISSLLPPCLWWDCFIQPLHQYHHRPCQGEGGLDRDGWGGQAAIQYIV